MSESDRTREFVRSVGLRGRECVSILVVGGVGGCLGDFDGLGGGGGLLVFRSALGWYKRTFIMS